MAARPKYRRPRSLRHAMELCLDHARTRQLSVDRIADLMGLASKWVLYKWMESARIPANLIRPFENACGATYLTDYLGASAQKLLIDIPMGRKCAPTDLATLQQSFAECIGLLSRFYSHSSSAEDTLEALKKTMFELAWHQSNVTKLAAPELALFGDADER